MKTISGLFTALFLIIIISSCSNSNDATAVVNDPISGSSWKVSYFFDNTDETSDYSSYTFKFNDDGQVTATSGAIVKSGIWSETATRLTIDFGTDPLLEQLNDDWVKEEKTATSIKLKEDNPAQDDRLQFVKL